MKLLNLGCGAVRPKDDRWTNLDDLHTLFPRGPERDQLDAEPNYVNFRIGSGPLPFASESFDGVLASHFLEHFDCQEAAEILLDCKRILKPAGILMASVPDAAYFLRCYGEDRNENWPRLFGVTDPANPIPTFFEAALWFSEHKAILDETALRCYFLRAGLGALTMLEWDSSAVAFEMRKHLNREPFSLTLAASKP